MIDEFDANRDRRVERAELAACLAQNNAYGSAFSVESINDFHGNRKQDSPLFLLLDQDQDGQLSPAEMAAACVRLRSRDVDDDDVVAVTDFRRPGSNDQAMFRRHRKPYQAIELNQLEADSIYYTMRELYDEGGGLDAASFALTPGLLAQLDSDQNGTVGRAELAAMVDARCDLLLKVNLGQKSRGEQPALELKELSDDLVAARATAQVVQRRLRVEVPACGVDIIVDDSPADGDGRSYRALQVQVRAGELEDSLFGWLDSNHDGRLTLREMLGAGERLVQLDQDGDHVVTAAEIPDNLACIISRGIRSQDTTPFGPPTGPRIANSDAPAWLAAMDQNSDGEISPREFLGTSEQFSLMDLNADGFLDVDEARQQAESAAAAP
jgi:Ca2+-binding EF-hand superfamily protein